MKTYFLNKVLENLSLTPLGNEALLAINELLQIKMIGKGDFFLDFGSTCHEIAILEKGIFRVYYHSNDKIHTSYFNTETRNPFVSSFTSFLKKSPSIEAIEALEDSIVHSLTYDQLHQLYKDFPQIQELGRIMAEHNYLLAIERIYDLQQQNASYKYNKFLELYPGLINRIPHHYIASYLGITPESLSRIRKSKE